MIRGTTPTITFNCDCDCSEFELLEITFAQCNNVVFTKKKEDCEINGSQIIVTLTEEETLLFDSKKNPVQMQIRAGIGKTRTASTIMFTTAEKILKDGCLYIYDNTEILIYGFMEDVADTFVYFGAKVTDSASEHYKRYYIAITVNDETTELYLPAPLRVCGTISDYINIKNGTVNINYLTNRYLFEYGAIFEVINAERDIKQIKFSFNDNEMSEAKNLTVAQFAIKNWTAITADDLDQEGAYLVDDGIMFHVSSDTLGGVTTDDEMTEALDMILAENNVEFIYERNNANTVGYADDFISLPNGTIEVTATDKLHTCGKIIIKYEG